MQNLLEFIARFPEQKVLVVGDVMLDRYLWCEVERISPEAPVPVARVTREDWRLGGAANVAANLRSLGAKVEMVGVVGKDSEGVMLQEILRKEGIFDNGVARVSGRPTIMKTRVMAQGQQMLRVDQEDVRPLGAELEEEILARLSRSLEEAKVVVVSDYAKGLVSDELALKILEEAGRRGIKVLADPVPDTFGKFRGSYLIKPNRREAEFIAGMKLENDFSNIKELCQILRERLKSHLLVTLGKDGMALFEGGEVIRIPTSAREVFDVSGAGDTVMAALALSISSGADLQTASRIANVCAGVVVGKLGTATCSREDLDQALGEIHEREN